ncbi:hypothetical protein KP509_01G085300 [Ceratopteris richardii]|uniref:Peptidase C14 caspase domain-containing protein n=1 Tax=Ceratopteris richardii TaxID=49495 RepID=A0A8T2VIT5_CERRI|nr:hypothetical protein KP509_01G085300 [Ceratopteris richardii]
MTKKAVLVGCNYPGTKAELRGCINDVNRIEKTLIERFGFAKSDIQVLIDTDSGYVQPTGANIRSALDKMVTESKPGDVLFFHYSGHGVRLPAEMGHYDDTGYDECIVPCDMNLITDDDLRELVDRVPKGVQFTLISDSCHSGGLVNNAKEQIGESTRLGGSVVGAAVAVKSPAKKPPGKKRELGLTEGLKSFVSEKVHAVLEDRGISPPDLGLPRMSHQHAYQDQDEYFQSVPYEGEGNVKSRSLQVSTLLEILKEKTGREDLDGMHNDSDDDDDDDKDRKHHHDLRGAVGALAHRFLKQKLDEEESADEYLKPAMEIEVTDRKAAYAGGKAAGKIGAKPAGKTGGAKTGGSKAGGSKTGGTKAGGSKGGGKAIESKDEETLGNVNKDAGILISGCQSHETSADASPNGTEGESYGAMSNALQTILSQQKGPITYHDLVTKVREMLKKEGFSQHPGLYCSDELATAPFVC